MSPDKRHVDLDPDGTWAPTWLAVIVAAPTSVIYEQQCGGTATLQRSLEGYLVPLGGLKFEPEQGVVDPAELTAVFHEGRRCCWGGPSSALPEARLVRLTELVASVPFWTRAADGESTRGRLVLDADRLGELVEAWVPVSTPDGPGVLVWWNCD